MQSFLPTSDCLTKIVDGSFEDHFAQFQDASSRTHSEAERALDRREDGFDHPAAVVPATAHPGVVSPIKRRVDAVLDQGTYAIMWSSLRNGFPS